MNYDYIIVDDLSQALDTNMYHMLRERALDDLFAEAYEGDLRTRPDGKLEMFFQGKWELHG
jgi:hypothetical protein